MPIAGRNDVRNLEAGMLLVGLGAILLLISLFLEWYQPNVDAWEIFEVWDLVLALLAVCAIVAVAGRLGLGPPRPASMVLGPSIAALVIVLFAFLDPPPLTAGIDGDPGTGLWLALAATVLMAAGAALSFARVSVVLTQGPAAASVADPAASGTAAAPADPRVADPVGGGPFAPRASVVDPGFGSDPIAPGDPVAERPATSRFGGRFARQPEDSTAPTEPRRPI